MKLSRLLAILIILPILACGGSEREADNGEASDQDRSEAVPAIILHYEISISDIPLVDPQTERIEMAVSPEMIKYTGVTEISVDGDSRQLKRSSILDFSDQSQTFLDAEDSSFTVSFYEIPERIDTADDTLKMQPYDISLILIDEKKTIPPLEECRKVNVRSRVNSKLAKSDSIPKLRGELWVYEDDEISQIQLSYYNMLADFLGDPEFDGLELWGVLNRLGIPREEIQGVLRSLEGLVAEADLTVEMYSLGKKASVKVSMKISDFEKKRLPGTYFNIPAEYDPAFEVGQGF
jgi:hypothetical protein